MPRPGSWPHSSGRTLYFCGAPPCAAWPQKYTLRPDFSSSGSPAGATLVITTRGCPTSSRGAHPDNLCMERIEVNYPATPGARSSDLGCSVPTRPTGLVQVDQSSARLVTRGLFTPAPVGTTWRRAPSSARSTGAATSSADDDVGTPVKRRCRHRPDRRDALRDPDVLAARACFFMRDRHRSCFHNSGSVYGFGQPSTDPMSRCAAELNRVS